MQTNLKSDELVQEEQSLLQRIEESRKRIVDMNAENKAFDQDLILLDPHYILETLKDCRDAIQESTSLLSKFADLLVTIKIRISIEDLNIEKILEQLTSRIKKNKF